MFTDARLSGDISALSLVLVRLSFEVSVYLYTLMNDYKGTGVGGVRISVKA